MAKTVKVDWKEFMSGTFKQPSKLQIVVEHIERNKVIYKVAGATVVLFLATDVSAFAASADFNSNDAVSTLSQDGSIDAKAEAFYKGKLLTFGKWAIIFKGGWATVNKTLKEDFDGAKKSFLQYLVVYIILLGFPWALKEAEGLFV